MTKFEAVKYITDKAGKKVSEAYLQKVSRERAIEIAMNHNCISREIAKRYTNSELKEVLAQLKLKAAF